MTNKVKIRRHLVSPLCFVCPSFAHELVKEVGWIAWCRDPKEEIRADNDTTPQPTCPGYGRAIVQSRGPSTPEQQAEGERLRKFDEHLAEAEKILASGKIVLESIKDREVRLMVFNKMKEKEAEAEFKAAQEAEAKRSKEQEKELKRMVGISE